jgi:glycosyltransferase involved in cell wall biosynthesis
MKPTISACIIAKDEEENLPRCLESVKGLCDEIVFFDTGSTDSTIDIAKGYGCKFVKVDDLDEYFVDINGKKRIHFARARNKVFENAKGDWLLVIDCDEQLIANDINTEKFKERLSQVAAGVGSLVFTVFEKDGDNYASWLGMRLFRASANPRYKNYVHNKVECEGLAAGTDIQLRHYGYHLTPEKMAEKRERTRDMLLKRIEDDPDDYNAYYYLCQIAQGDKEWQKSVDYGRKCFELLPIDDPEEMQFYATLYFWVANSYIQLWKQKSEDPGYDGIDGGNAKQWILKGLEFFPDDLDLNYVMVLFYYMAGNADNYKDAVRAGRKYFKSLRKTKSRKNYETGNFVNIMQKKDFIPRAMYCIGDTHKKSVVKWIRAMTHENS